jgi:phenylalanyl-tRNA synthetase alpha subunit
MPEVDATKKKHLEEKRAKNFAEWKEGKESEGETQVRLAAEKRNRNVKEQTKRVDNKHPFSEHLDKLHHFFELMNKGNNLF